MFRSERAGLLRPKRAFVALGTALLALTPLVVAFVIASGIFPLVTLLIHPVLFGTMALVYGFRSTRGAKVDEGTLRVDGQNISVGETIAARRDELKGAFIVPTDEGTLVHLVRKGRLAPSVFVRVQSREQAAAFLRELGFDAERTAAEMKIASGLLGMSLARQLALMLLPILLFIPASVVAVALFKSAAGMLAGVALLLTYAFGMAFSPTTVRIGTDGIATRWLGRNRFIKHSDIARTETYDEHIAGKQQRGVRLALQSGEEIRLATGQTDIGKVEATRLAHRIEEARSAAGTGAKGGTTDLLTRGKRTVVDWVRHLRGMGAGAVGLRTSAPTPDVLLRIVEDSRAAPIERASAAVAAIASGEDDVRRRVRIAADTTASPKLRIALERIAADTPEPEEDALLAEALEELNEERGAS
jgi:hypothetical protein